MPIDPSRESWKPGMGWEQAVDDIGTSGAWQARWAGRKGSNASTRVAA